MSVEEGGEGKWGGKMKINLTDDLLLSWFLKKKKN
jgi:hypothetical protein